MQKKTKSILMRDVYEKYTNASYTCSDHTLVSECCDALLTMTGARRDTEAYYAEHTRIIDKIGQEVFFKYILATLQHTKKFGNTATAGLVILMKYCFSRYTADAHPTWIDAYFEELRTYIVRFYAKPLTAYGLYENEYVCDLEMRLCEEFALRPPTHYGIEIFSAYRAHTPIGESLVYRILEQLQELYENYKKAFHGDYAMMCCVHIGYIIEFYTALPDQALHAEISEWILGHRDIGSNPLLVQFCAQQKNAYSEASERAMKAIVDTVMYNEDISITPISLLETYKKICENDTYCEKKENIDILDALCTKITEDDCEKLLKHSPHLKGLLYPMLVQYGDILEGAHESPDKVAYIRELARLYKFRYFLFDARYDRIEKFLLHGFAQDVVIAGRLIESGRLQLHSDYLQKRMYVAPPLRAFASALCLCSMGTTSAVEYVKEVFNAISSRLLAVAFGDVEPSCIEHYLQHFSLVAELGHTVEEFDYNVYVILYLGANREELQLYRERIFHYAALYFMHRGKSGCDYLLTLQVDFVPRILYMIGTNDAVSALQTIELTQDTKNATLARYYCNLLQYTNHKSPEKNRTEV